MPAPLEGSRFPQGTGSGQDGRRCATPEAVAARARCRTAFEGPHNNEMQLTKGYRQAKVRAARHSAWPGWAACRTARLSLMHPSQLISVLCGPLGVLDEPT